jgi:hypothetical protein
MKFRTGNSIVMVAELHTSIELEILKNWEGFLIILFMLKPMPKGTKIVVVNVF